MADYLGAFLIEENPDGTLRYIGHREDPSKMNWIQETKDWGKLCYPETIQATVERRYMENGHLQERYIFKNISSFPVFFQKTELGIYVSFHDNYWKSEECLEKRCHAHIFCGGQAAYVMALRMGGSAPHLGLMLATGGISSYSIERNLSEKSSGRGDIILHPEIDKLDAGESREICWELFWFEDRDDFENELLKNKNFPVIKIEQCTFLDVEPLTFKILLGRELKKEEMQIVCRNQEIPFEMKNDGMKTMVSCQYQAKEEGAYRFEIKMGDKSTYALLYRCASLTKMIERRCRFIAEKQQFTQQGSPLDGAYLIYDREDEKLYYSHLDDHNGGRERLGMGALLAAWLQHHPDERLLSSLLKYKDYVYRELYDKQDGTVFNDILKNNDWDRLYNYPWMAVFQLKLYGLLKDTAYLEDAFHTIKQFYAKGGRQFYPIGLPLKELYFELKRAKMTEEAEEICSEFVQHAEILMKNGIHYPESEVPYEQSIVAPAADCLLQAYQITGDAKYKEAAETHMEILGLFHGNQPDYHLYKNAIRHWDGYWFGKYRNFGDTFPHYWSVMTGVVYAEYVLAGGDVQYREEASAVIRGCFNLFFSDGTASCAMVFPEQVNGKKMGYYDPWANDQDWALYYALKYAEVL